MRPIISLLILLALLSQAVQSQAVEGQRAGRPYRDAEGGNRERNANGRRPAATRRGQRDNNRRNQRGTRDKNYDLQQSDEDSTNQPEETINLQAEAESQEKRGDETTEHREAKNGRQGKRRKQPPPRPLIELLIIVVVGLLLLLALLILKPILLRRVNQVQPPPVPTNKTLEEATNNAPNTFSNSQNPIIIKEECQIEIIKGRFLNKKQPQTNQIRFQSNARLDQPNLRLTPTFGEYTFRNNN